jgi:flagellar hook-basal body complex protein FliE
MSINNVNKFANAAKPIAKAASNQNYSGATFNTFLQEAVDSQKTAKPVNTNNLVNAFTNMIHTNPAQSNSAFASAIVEDQIDKTYKKASKIQKENQNIVSNVNKNTNYLNQKENPGLMSEVQPDNKVSKPDNHENLIAQITPETPNEAALEMAEEADALTPQNVNTEGFRSNKLETTPFQLFIDKAVESLENLSTTEMRVNDLIEQYIEGKVSIEEVSTETAKLSMAISFATTVVTQITTTFKEIQNLPV